MQKSTFLQANRTLTIISGLNPSEEHIEILHSGYLDDLMQAIVAGTIPYRETLRAALGLRSIVSHPVVDYERTLEEMIMAGNYDSVHEEITSGNFPITGSGKSEWEFDLVHPSRDISTEDARKETAKDSDPSNPWIDAEIEHLLAYGEAFPEMQRKYPIIALGSTLDEGEEVRVPFLEGDDSNRDLGLRWSEGEGAWGDCCRFLRVRKKVPTAVSPPDF